jgi:DNA-binding NarL/FixJ family response regulator
MLLISNPQERHWQRLVKEVISPLGELEITSEKEWQEHFRRQTYALIIIDASISINPVYIVRQLRISQPEAKIVVMTDAPTWKQARELFYAGAADYLLKLSSPQELLAAFRQVLARQVVRD